MKACMFSPSRLASASNSSVLEPGYRGRSAVEREFGRLKHHYALAMLRVRGIERVRLHADLTIMGRLALELARARAEREPHVTTISPLAVTEHSMTAQLSARSK
jgi:hypothetical protein